MKSSMLVQRIIARRAFSSARPILQSDTLDSQQPETVELAYDLWEPRKGADPTKSPIVFLHGLFGSRTNNRSVSKILARDLSKQVYCLDLRNHGESPYIARHDYVAMAADVHRFIQDHKLQNPILIGHSMGARAAMGVGLMYPNMSLKALIPVDNGPLTMPLSSDFRTYINGMHAVDQAKCESIKEMDRAIEPYASEVGVRLFLLSNFKRNEDGYFRCRLPLETLAKSLGHMGDFDFFLPSKYRCTAPTLLIRGTQSHFVPDESLPLMGQLFPKFTVRDIDSGHWVISEKPQEFVEEVERFLDTD